MGPPINLQELSRAITRLLATQCTTPSPVPFASGQHNFRRHLHASPNPIFRFRIISHSPLFLPLLL